MDGLLKVFQNCRPIGFVIFLAITVLTACTTMPTIDSIEEKITSIEGKITSEIDSALGLESGPDSQKDDAPSVDIAAHETDETKDTEEVKPLPNPEQAAKAAALLMDSGAAGPHEWVISINAEGVIPYKARAVLKENGDGTFTGAGAFTSEGFSMPARYKKICSIHESDMFGTFTATARSEGRYLVFWFENVQSPFDAKLTCQVPGMPFTANERKIQGGTDYIASKLKMSKAVPLAIEQRKGARISEVIDYKELPGILSLFKMPEKDVTEFVLTGGTKVKEWADASPRSSEKWTLRRHTTVTAEITGGTVKEGFDQVKAGTEAIESTGEYGKEMSAFVGLGQFIGLIPEGPIKCNGEGAVPLNIPKAGGRVYGEGTYSETCTWGKGPHKPTEYTMVIQGEAKGGMLYFSLRSIMRSSENTVGRMTQSRMMGGQRPLSRPPLAIPIRVNSKLRESGQDKLTSMPINAEGSGETIWQLAK